MRPRLLQPVAWMTSLLLALPAGWCSGFVGHDAVASKAPVSTCCQPASHVASTDPSSVPVAPTVECCCAKINLLPVRPILPEDATAVLPGLMTNADQGELARSCVVAATGNLIDTGPPLHVLQCVWRC